MATGLSMQQAVQIMDKLTSDQTEVTSFEADPAGYLKAMGIDVDATLNGCSDLKSRPMPSIDDLRAARDAMVGRLLTAHLSQNIHHLALD